MNVVPAVPPGRGRRDREQVALPAGEEQVGALRARTASAINALQRNALMGIGLESAASATTVRGQIVLEALAGGPTVRVQTVFRMIDGATKNSERIDLRPSAAGMVKDRDSRTGEVPVVPMTSVPVEMIDPPRGTTTAVFVQTVPLIDVVQEMNGVSHPRDSVSTHHRAIVIIPLHVE